MRQCGTNYLTFITIIIINHQSLPILLNNVIYAHTHTTHIIIYTVLVVRMPKNNSQLSVMRLSNDVIDCLGPQ